MLDVGKVCVKIAGRDAGARCVIVDVLDAHYVIVDGATRRKKCNIIHLEPLNESLDIKKGASHDVVDAAFKAKGWVALNTKPHEKKAKPAKQRIGKAKTPEPAKPAKVDKPKAAKSK